MAEPSGWCQTVHTQASSRFTTREEEERLLSEGEQVIIIPSRQRVRRSGLCLTRWFGADVVPDLCDEDQAELTV